MAAKILVLGGTSFIGLALVRRLIETGADVTIATRGLSRDPFRNLVTRRKIDRSDPAGLKRLARSNRWDVVYDQICYSAEDAAVACDAFRGNAGRYIYTSSVVVYEPADNLVENDFDPCSHPVSSKREWSALSEHRRYPEGKKNAEAVFFRQDGVPVVAVRFPNVLGAHDPSRRLDWHIDCVNRKVPIFVPDATVRQSLIWSEDAARFLEWIGSQAHCGPINAASREALSIGELVALVAERLKTAEVYATSRTEDNHSPFGFRNNFTIRADLAERLGFRFTGLGSWLPSLIDEQFASPMRARDPALHAVLQKLHGRGRLTTEELNLLSRRCSELERLGRSA
jgi:nucleoside-diphosphate-sugar epimerase